LMGTRAEATEAKARMEAANFMMVLRRFVRCTWIFCER
jgi:hypothetical protein